MDRNDTVKKVQGTATALADRVRDAHLDERAAELAALAREKVRDAQLDERAAELAALAREKVRDARLDERAAELTAVARTKVRDSSVADQAGEVASQAAETARVATERALERVGEWLGDTDVGDRLTDTAVGERLGLDKKRRSRRWLFAMVAVIAGIAAGVVATRKREDADDDLSAHMGNGGGFTPAPAIASPLEERVREALGSDTRTAVVPPLNVNVVDGTVFVRGTVPADVDQEALRTVISSVHGVTDVDLQVTVSG